MKYFFIINTLLRLLVHFDIMLIIKVFRRLKMATGLEIEKQEFLYSLTPDDKKIVQKTIQLYYDFIDYQEAMKIKKAVDSGKMKTYSANEVLVK